MKIQYNVLKNQTKLIKICINAKKKEMNPKICKICLVQVIRKLHGRFRWNGVRLLHGINRGRAGRHQSEGTDHGARPAPHTGQERPLIGGSGHV